MSTKLQELLEELKGLKRFHSILDVEGEANTIECKTGDLVDWADIDTLITKYTEPIPTYKPRDLVKVVACINGHDFDINSEVMLLYYDSQKEMWKCVLSSEIWYLTEEEFEPIN
jgi:hypothetical protein